MALRVRRRRDIPRPPYRALERRFDLIPPRDEIHLLMSVDRLRHTVSVAVDVHHLAGLREGIDRSQEDLGVPARVRDRVELRVVLPLLRVEDLRVMREQALIEPHRPERHRVAETHELPVDLRVQEIRGLRGRVEHMHFKSVPPDGFGGALQNLVH